MKVSGAFNYKKRCGHQDGKWSSGSGGEGKLDFESHCDLIPVMRAYEITRVVQFCMRYGLYCYSGIGSLGF